MEKQIVKERAMKANSVEHETSRDAENHSCAEDHPVRTALKKEFDKAHQKTTAQHANLFRRLAE